MILLGPLFTLPGLLGRKWGLTSAEWLWVFAWAGLVLISGLEVLRNTAVLAVEWNSQYGGRPHWFWYLILVPAMALVGVIIALMGLVRRWQMPWTHNLSLVLVIWPVVPLILMLSLRLMLKPG